MPIRMISLVVLVALLGGFSVEVGAVYAQAEPESPDIFRIEVSQCAHHPELVRYLTGFRIAGVVGIVTALHGVADDCQKIIAVGGGSDGAVFDDLALAKVDVAHDVALLSSADVRSAKNPPQLRAASASETLQAWDKLQLIGYPFGVYGQLPSKDLQVRGTTVLGSLIPPGYIPQMRSRGSPSTSISIVSVEGHFLPGDSGAPVFNDQNLVVGIVNGGLQEGDVEISWMIPWADISLAPVTQADVKKRLDSLKVKDPLLVFATTDPGTDSANTPGPTPTAAVYKYKVVVLDANADSHIDHAIASLLIGGQLTTNCYTDSDGFCILRYVGTDQPARLRVEKTGYKTYEREIEDLLDQNTPQMIVLTPLATEPAKQVAANTIPATLAPPTSTPCPTSADPDLAGFYRPELGCATGSSNIVWSSYTPFERGFTLWRSDTKRFYGFFNGVGWADVADGWKDGMPEKPQHSHGDPPPGLLVPIRGTGWVWATYEDFFKHLGWATSEQRGFCAEIQEFANGFIARESGVGQCNDLSRNEPRTSRAGEAGFGFRYVAGVLNNRAWYP